MELPNDYLRRMEAMLGAEYSDYLASFSDQRVTSLRTNTRKIQPEDLKSRLPFLEEAVPWASEGFYFQEGVPSKHPYYFAGLYYLQEASAMSPGAMLPIVPGDRVLDLCGAPGGKATHLGARLAGTGVLFANDISASRAQAMVKNLELSGIGNCYVTAETPEKLAENFPSYFDKILVDAPCSGEGMFRRDPAIIKDWIERGPAYYQPIQREILTSAVKMLRPGGMLLYSTCTFSKEEDEDNVSWLLHDFPEIKLQPIPQRPGISEGFLPGTGRIWPHRVRGEGHFLALFQKETAGEARFSKEAAVHGQPFYQKKSRPFSVAAPDFAPILSGEWGERPVWEEKGNLYFLPPEAEKKARIRYLRTGLFLGTCKDGRFTPSPALALVLKPDEYPNRVDFSASDERAIRYLKGETVTCEGSSCAGADGWTLVLFDGFPLGWAKRNKTTLKNKYNPGWRWQ
ncbi:RsmB/NOP family class I SAM-dependent RNA methyltransferase [Hominifimenecus sp. rT4P-3]|uniref:RsmB/NOP family class I SAM-dependent RNA methyltransferase n=1 Tax=Hominifimenecus sp. rT4P-3 TaxID=3242979 RepID=UPI003DA5A130